MCKAKTAKTACSCIHQHCKRKLGELPISNLQSGKTGKPQASKRRQLLSMIPHLNTINVKHISHDQGLKAPYQEFIKRGYRQHFGAEITHFLPEVLALDDHKGKVLGALGLRQGNSKQSFFLEHYLSEPVERLLSKLSKESVQPFDLVEIGNLCSGTPQGGSLLMLSLAGFLDGAGFKWGVFTVTTQIRKIFTKLNIPLIDLAPARLDMLPPSRDEWGHYYDFEPRVMAANVAQTRESLFAQENLIPILSLLWPSAYQLGLARLQQTNMVTERFEAIR